MVIPRTLDVSALLPRKSFFLLGPRATGKSTLVATQLPDAIVYDLLDDDVYTRLLKRPRAQGISNDAGVPVRTVQSFVQMLEDTLVGFSVPAFAATKRRKAITRPKFYLFDVGVTGALAHRGEIRERSELFGRALEHFIALELRAHQSYKRLSDGLCYWRSTSGYEVEFVVGKRLAIVVKATHQVSDRDLRGLRALREEGMVERYLVVSLDEAKRKVDGIEIWPWRAFLTALWRGTFH